MKFEPSDWRAAGLAVYLFAGLNTFGYRWNHSPEAADAFGTAGRTVEAAAIAAVWPIYWPCKLAIKLWEPPASVPAQVPQTVPQIPELNMVAPPKQLSMGGPDDILIFRDGMAVWINKTNIISYPTR